MSLEPVYLFGTSSRRTHVLIQPCFKERDPLSGSEWRVRALVWHPWNDEEERMPMEPAWRTISTMVFSQAKMSQADHIHFWHLFQALGNRSGKGTRHYLHFLSKEREIVPCLLFHRVDLAKAIFLIFLGNIEILWWHIHGLFSLDDLISFSEGKFLPEARCFWHWWRGRRLVLFILFDTRFFDILSSFSCQYVSLAIIPAGFKYTWG